MRRGRRASHPPGTPGAPITKMPRTLPWRTLIHFAIAVAATWIFVEIAEEVLEGEYDAPDRAIALAIHHHLDSWLLDRVMITVTHLGSGPMITVVVVATVVWLLRAGHRRAAAILVTDAVVSQLLVYALKELVQRPRPTLFDEITRPETWSFPSGHSLSAMAIYGSIAAVVIIYRRAHRGLVIAAATLLIGAIGFSRIYLGVHWPFDVLAGFAAGVPLVVATVHLLHTRGGPKGHRQADPMNVYSRA